jgi:hypothetical protein
VDAPNNISHQSCLMTRRDGQCGEQPGQPQLQACSPSALCVGASRPCAPRELPHHWRTFDAACSPFRTQDRAFENSAQYDLSTLDCEALGHGKRLGAIADVDVDIETQASNVTLERGVLGGHTKHARGRHGENLQVFDREAVSVRGLLAKPTNVVNVCGRGERSAQNLQPLLQRGIARRMPASSPKAFFSSPYAMRRLCSCEACFLLAARGKTCGNRFHEALSELRTHF